MAKIPPQSGYTSFLSGYKPKFNYCMRTIPDKGKLLKQVNEIILTKFIPAIVGRIFITENYRKLVFNAPIRRIEYANI